MVNELVKTRQRPRMLVAALATAFLAALVLIPLSAPTANAADWPTLERGDSGANVQAVQHLLTAAGHGTDADGAYGPNTEAAVSAFQAANGLPENGIVDADTWAALAVDTGSGDQGPAAEAAQVLLNKHGYGLVTDGIFGARTEAAASGFQADNGLPETGQVDAATWQGLAGTAAVAYTLPLPRASLPRSEYDDPHHDYPAIDLPVWTGTDVFAARGGTVSIVDDSSCGQGVVLNGTDGGRYVYCHFSAWTVFDGQVVTTGQQIGESGNTGNSSGPHLHFGVGAAGNNFRCPQPLLLAIYDYTTVPDPASLPTSGCSY